MLVQSMIPNLKPHHWLPALIALAMIIFGVVTSAVNTRDNLREAAEVAHTREVLLTLQDTLRCMLDLETGQRGFVIVGEESYLEPYNTALRRLDTQIAMLTDLTRDNAEQQVRIGSITEVIAQRKRSLVRAIEARRTGGEDAAIHLVKTGTGKAEMDRLRQLVDEMRDEELTRLDNRESKLAKSLRRTDLTVTITGVVAVGSGAIGALLLALFLIARDREQQERSAREKAEDADRAKSDFLAMMSHEIRTPMNSILGFGELLHDLVDTPQEKHFAKAILTSGNSLLSLINDILDLSKIEAGKLDLNPESVLIDQFAENLQTLFSFRAAEKGLHYEFVIDPKTPPRLTFDALRLRQILVNLVGNAIKFTREGSVTVSLRADPVAGADTVMLHIDVTDSGIGIPEDRIAEIFRPFYQIDSRQGRQFQGTGLGLSISRRLIEAMEGTLSVESELGKGSVFRVTLPTRMSRRTDEILAADKASGPIDFNLLRPAKILVADDVPLNRDLIRNYLAGSHHQIIEAENGEQAVSLCIKHHPDIVLMDIRMPALDGREALAKLRSMEDTRHIPLIAVTASSLLNSQEELKSMFDGYADKPLNRGALYQQLARFIPAEEHIAAVEEIPSPVTPASEPANDWTPLCAELEKLQETVWPNLVKLVPAQATLNFGKRLSELATEHGCPLLATHASELMLAAEMMDFAEASRLLGSFPQIIATLRASHA
jgi:signal transduction histidine kinase/ActR/RegA family two-component response regulator